MSSHYPDIELKAAAEKYAEVLMDTLVMNQVHMEEVKVKDGRPHLTLCSAPYISTPVDFFRRTCPGGRQKC